jgi:hypothetical protein
MPEVGSEPMIHVLDLFEEGTCRRPSVCNTKCVQHPGRTQLRGHTRYCGLVHRPRV